MDENPYKSPEYVADAPKGFDARPNWVRWMIPQGNSRWKAWLGVGVLSFLAIGWAISSTALFVEPSGWDSFLAGVVLLGMSLGAGVMVRMQLLAMRWMDRHDAWPRDGE